MLLRNGALGLLKVAVLYLNPKLQLTHDVTEPLSHQPPSYVEELSGIAIKLYRAKTKDQGQAKQSLQKLKS